MRKRMIGSEEEASAEDPIPTLAGIKARADKTKAPNTCGERPFLGLLLALLLFLVTVAWKAFDRQENNQLSSSVSMWDLVAEDACKSYDSAYFSSLMDTVQQMPRNASLFRSLCDLDLQKTACRCQNPFVAVEQDLYRVPNWREIHRSNVDWIRSSLVQPPELVLYGDSLTERLRGRMFGKSGPKLKEYAEITERLFTKGGGGSINGLALGISSDEIPNLLYRLQNGEMPKSLQPKVWWILIGTNDARRGCSADVIVAGNLHIVQELARHSATRNTPIVINSLLPRGAQALTAPSNSLWKILRTANQQLECYAAITPGVYFANVTDKFVETESDGKTFLRPSLFEKDQLHISSNGSKVWEEFIVERVLSLTASAGSSQSGRG